MAYINEHYLKLQAGYLFPEIGRRVNEFTQANPDAAARLIRCGIGDVTEALPAACVEALHSAVDEMANRDSFRGYGPELGYEFLREAIAENDFAARGVNVGADEIFISDGAKCDTANILDILGHQNRIAITDPVYPVYLDTNVMAGHTGNANDAGQYEGIVYLPCTAENNFVPAFPQRRQTLFTCVTPITRPVPPPRASNSPVGWRTPRRTTPSSCTMPPTRRSFRTATCRIPFTRSKARAIARLSSAAFRKTPASPAPVAPSRLCPRN